MDIMDIHIPLILVRRIILPVIGVVIVAIIIGGLMIWERIKSTLAKRKHTQSDSIFHHTSKGRFTGRKILEWIQVGDYNIFVHKVTEQWHTNGHKKERVIHAEVEYRNQTQEENMSCRRNQWHLYSKHGYSYEAKSELEASYLYEEKKYFGGERYINPEMNARGWFAFPVPEDAEITVLQFMTAFIGTKTADIRVESVMEQNHQHPNLWVN